MSPGPVGVAVAVAVADTSARRRGGWVRGESSERRQNGQDSREEYLSFFTPTEAKRPGDPEAAGRMEGDVSSSRPPPPHPHPHPRPHPQHVDHFPIPPDQQHRRYYLLPSRPRRRQEGIDAAETGGVGTGPRGGKGLGQEGRRAREYGRRRWYKARLSGPELDERTWGVGRVSWSLG